MTDGIAEHRGGMWIFLNADRLGNSVPGAELPFLFNFFLSLLVCIFCAKQNHVCLLNNICDLIV